MKLPILVVSGFLLMLLASCGEGKKGTVDEVQPTPPTPSPLVNPTGGIPDVPKWFTLTTTGAPTARKLHSAVWSGSEMIIYGGIQLPPDDPEGRVSSRILFSTGGAYNPTTDSWRPIAELTMAEPRSQHTATWANTVSRMVVWGGAVGEQLRTGALYHPASDTWSLMTTNGSPTPRYSHAAAWTGSHVFIFGGINLDEGTLAKGSLYDPSRDTWTSVTTNNQPSPRHGHTLTPIKGSQIAVFGGFKNIDSSDVYGDGSLYKYSNNTWTTMTTSGSPSPRAWHSAVWTGNRLIIWGGKGGDAHTGTELRDGALYNPDNDRWSPISTTNAPSARMLHSAIWTGEKMVIWGGETGSTPLGDGAIYDPDTDKWEALPATNQPKKRHSHSAVWTNSEIIFFGGITQTSSPTEVAERKDGGILRWVRP